MPKFLDIPSLNPDTILSPLVFVGSGIFKARSLCNSSSVPCADWSIMQSGDAAKRARAIVQAVSSIYHETSSFAKIADP